MNNVLLGKFICNRFCLLIFYKLFNIYVSFICFLIINNSLKYIFNLKTFVDDDGFSKLDLNIFESSLLVLFCYLITIIFSHFSYNYIEKKYNKF